MSDHIQRMAEGELRAFVERIERTDVEKREAAEAQKEVYAEAKHRGYDAKAIRKIVAMRKLDPSDLAEEEAVLKMYREAMGV